jgi:hypothetical protein
MPRQPQTPCPHCDNPTCNGKTNELREYTGYYTKDSSGEDRYISAWTELTLHADEAKIVEWVNKYAEHIARQRYYHQRNNVKQRMLREVASKLLDADEIKRLEEEAKERAERKLRKEGNK